MVDAMFHEIVIPPFPYFLGHEIAFVDEDEGLFLGVQTGHIFAKVLASKE